MPIFNGAYAAGADYLDMAMSLSHRDPEAPYERESRPSGVTFKYGLGTEFIDVLKTLNKLGLDKTEPVNVKGALVSAANSKLRRSQVCESWAHEW